MVARSKDFPWRCTVAVGLAVLFEPATAYAQDATVLVVLAAPPFVLALLVTAVIRGVWMRRVPGSRFSLRSGLPLSVLEFVLWLVAGGLAAAVYFQEKWGAAVILVILLALVVAINRRFAPPQASWLFAAALAGVFPIAWLAVQSIWYGAVVMWDRQ